MTAPAALDPVDALDLTPEETQVSEFAEHTIPSVDQVATPETPAVETPATEPALPEGYKKDSLGRVHGPDGKVVSKEALAALATVPQQPDNTARPTPFQYRANKETKPVDGWEQHADGSVRVSPEKVSELRQLLNARDVLAQGSEYVDQIKARNAALEQEIETYKTGATAEAKKADALVAQLTRILQIEDERTFLAEIFGLKEQYPVLLERAKAAHWEQVAKSGRPAQPKTQDTQATRETAPPAGWPTREIAVDATREHLERLKLEHQYRDVTPEDWKQFEAGIDRKPMAYLRPATDEEATQYHVRPSQIVFDEAALATDVQSHTASVRAARETAASAAKLAADNARRTTPSVSAPPTPGSAPAPAKTRKPPTNEKEWDAFMDSDELF